MKILDCKQCGSKELTESGGYFVCAYCRSKYLAQVGELLPPDTVIGLANDIEVLLQKCRDDPSRSRRLASLVLDIDPTNVEAMKYLA